MIDPSADKLLQISTLFKDLYQQVERALGSDVRLDSSCDRRAEVPALHLPAPDSHDLVRSLTAAGSSFELASEIARIHTARAQDLAGQYLDVYRRTCDEISCAYRPPFHDRASKIFSRLQRLRTLYDDSLRRWKMEYISLVTMKRKCGSSIKNEFKRDFIPYLEMYFRQNMYPSLADKRSLAKASGMSVEQITNWFQNHRNRYKASPCIEDVQSTSQDTTLGATSRIGECGSSSELTVVDSGEEVQRPWSRSSSVTLVEDVHPFDAFPSPPYAFPTPYPPDESIDPFPAEDGVFVFRVAKPVWGRSPAVQSPPVAEVDIESLVLAFAKMEIGTTRPASRRRVATWGLDVPIRRTGFNVMAFYTSRPLPAPLPCLVNAKRRCPCSNSSSCSHIALCPATRAVRTRSRKASRRTWCASQLSTGVCVSSRFSRGGRLACDSRFSSGCGDAKSSRAGEKLSLSKPPVSESTFTIGKDFLNPSTSDSPSNPHEPRDPLAMGIDLLSSSQLSSDFSNFDALFPPYFYTASEPLANNWQTPLLSPGPILVS